MWEKHKNSRLIKGVKNIFFEKKIKNLRLWVILETKNSFELHECLPRLIYLRKWGTSKKKFGFFAINDSSWYVTEGSYQ